MSLPCVITGCALVHHGRWIAGDLFDAGDHWVFNGNWNRSEPNEPTWITRMDACHYRCRFEPTDWFERRGVFVIHKSNANLNQDALEYIRWDGQLATTRVGTET